MTVAQVVPIASETLEVESRTRLGIVVESFDYLPSETKIAPPLTVRPGLVASEVVPPFAALRTRSLLTAAEVVPDTAALRVRSLLTAAEVTPISATLTIRSRIVVTSGNPIQNLSPIFWYDFSETSTVTTSGSEITGISDQGSLGWNLTKSGTGPTLAGWGNGKNCADWGSGGHNNSLRYVHSGSPVNVAQVFIVLDANFGSTFSNYNGLISNLVDDSIDFSIVAAAGSAGLDTSGPNWLDYATLNGGSTNVISSVLPGINSRCVLMIKRSSGAAPVLDDGFQIGNDRSNSGRGWGGLFGLAVGFSTVQSSDDTTNIINFLMEQWSV